MDCMGEHAGSGRLTRIAWAIEVNRPYLNPAPEVCRISFVYCYDAAASACFDLLGQLNQKCRPDAFDEDVNVTGASEPPPCIKTHQCRLARTQNVARLEGYLFFQAAAAERSDGLSIPTNQHARARSPVTRTFRANQGSKGELILGTIPDFTQNVVDVFHYLTEWRLHSYINLSGVIGKSRRRFPVAWKITFTTAAGVPTMPISPMPRAPRPGI
jgi:hypothetical protein